MGRVLNRLRDAYEKGDIAEARKQQVDVDDHCAGAARFHLDLSMQHKLLECNIFDVTHIAPH